MADRVRLGAPALRLVALRIGQGRGYRLEPLQAREHLGAQGNAGKWWQPRRGNRHSPPPGLQGQAAGPRVPARARQADGSPTTCATSCPRSRSKTLGLDRRLRMVSRRPRPRRRVLVFLRGGASLGRAARQTTGSHEVRADSTRVEDTRMSRKAALSSVTERTAPLCPCKSATRLGGDARFGGKARLSAGYRLTCGLGRGGGPA